MNKIAVAVTLAKIVASASLALVAFAGHQPPERSVTFEPSAPLDATQLTIGEPQEDDLDWDCATMGNHLCG